MQDVGCSTDPSTGSPIETLLRLYLHLNFKIWTTSPGALQDEISDHHLVGLV